MRVLILWSLCVFPVLLSAGDTLRVRIFTKARHQPVNHLKLQVEGKDSLMGLDEKGFVKISHLKSGSYTLIAAGEGFRRTLRKVESKDFNTKDTLRIEVLPYWTLSGSESLSFAQVGFSDYWQAGGASSVAARAEVKLNPRWIRGKHDLDSRARLAYGVIRQGKNEWLKNEDQIELSAKYGYRVSERFLITSLADARSQFHQTYKITREGSRGSLLSDFLAPGYFNLGTGMDFQDKKKGFSIYYSPLNTKLTVVRDTSLSRLYLPAGYTGRIGRYELGSYLNVRYSKEIVKNITLQTKADFFTNHLQNFGAIDMNWETQMAFKVNKYVTANILSQVIYDEDILFDLRDSTGQLTGSKGPRTQFRQALNVGVTHVF